MGNCTPRFTEQLQLIWNSNMNNSVALTQSQQMKLKKKKHQPHCNSQLTNLVRVKYLFCNSQVLRSCVWVIFEQGTSEWSTVRTGLRGFPATNCCPNEDYSTACDALAAERRSRYGNVLSASASGGRWVLLYGARGLRRRCDELIGPLPAATFVNIRRTHEERSGVSFTQRGWEHMGVFCRCGGWVCGVSDFHVGDQSSCSIRLTAFSHYLFKNVTIVIPYP